MACQLALLAPFHDTNAIRKFLFPAVKIEDDDVAVSNDWQEELGDWDEAEWGWKVDEESEEADREAGKAEKNDGSLIWLQECHLSLSPTGELLALAREDRLVLLEQRWDSKYQNHSQMKYAVAVTTTVAQEQGETITSLLCLPLASHKRSTTGGPDWTCVVVGFSSGYVRMYTEGGKLLLSQIFSEEPVSRIKCRTYETPRHMCDAEKHEELTILYKRSLVTVDGFSLFQSLRACRNQVARAAASGSELVQPPPLAYKKWALLDQDSVADHISCGIVTPNPFDQMCAASMLSGPSAIIKPTPPASHLYLSAGTQPYVAAFYAVEGSAQPMLSDVAHAVANKLKTALFSQISAASGWFGIGGKHAVDNNKEKVRPKIEPAVSLPARFGLPDKRRDAKSLVLSPDSRLAATTDSFGRVILLDVERGIAVRMWKGYRDAQVGWVEVKEDFAPDKDPNTPTHIRRAFFFIIYAPRRGILEVWTSQQGPRVAAFNVSKFCQLLCPGYSMMGLNVVTCQTMKMNPHQCYLVDPEAGVKTLDIPFHLSLSDKNSKRARDLHLLKKLKMCLKDHSEESIGVEDQVLELLLDMRIGSIKQQGIERVLHTRYLGPECLYKIISALHSQLEQLAQDASSEEGGELDYESRMLLQFCAAEQRLLGAFSALTALNEQKPSSTDTTDIISIIPRTVGVYGDDLSVLRDQLSAYHKAVEKSSTGTRVTFSEAEPTFHATDFLSCFECQLQRDTKSGEQPILSTKDADDVESTSDDGGKVTNKASLHIHIRTTLHETRYTRLGNFIMKRRLHHGTSSEFEQILRESGIPPEDLLRLLVCVWLSSDAHQLEDTPNFATALKSISQLKDVGEVSVEHNKLSPWWQKMRDLCAESESIPSALLAALIGRSAANDMMIQAKESGTISSSTELVPSQPLSLTEWESVTTERIQWTTLVRQLEDLLILQNLLKSSLNQDVPSCTEESISVNVKHILDGGRRVLPELVARWLAAQGVAPAMLCFNAEDTDKQSVDNPLASKLAAVQQRLPHSLSTDILMANCAWEYCLMWNKDAEYMEPLQQALAYLHCINNQHVQHGVAVMMWRTFLKEKLSATAKLMQKVGKAPREYLCRRDVGLTHNALEKLLGLCVQLLDTMTSDGRSSSAHESQTLLNVEDLWVGVSGPASLVEMAAEQKESHPELLSLHLHLAAIMHAIMEFNMKAITPHSLFNGKAQELFFNPLDSSPMVSNQTVEDAIRVNRQQFLCRVVRHAVGSIAERHAGGARPLSRSCSVTSSYSSSPGGGSSDVALWTWLAATPTYQHWTALALRLAKEMGTDEDVLRQVHATELYSAGLDKLAEEVLLTVNNHPSIGSELLQIAGSRLHQMLFISDPEGGIDILTKISPNMSSWIKSLDVGKLQCADVPLKDTATLVGHVVNQLPESHPDYSRAIQLVELTQVLL